MVRFPAVNPLPETSIPKLFPASSTCFAMLHLRRMTNPSPFIHLEKAIGIRFRNKDLLLQALVHRSAVRESHAHGNNERLEFLGDAVLELATTEYLFHISGKSEGELTNWRSALVQGRHLAEVAKELKLGEYLFMSRGEEASKGRSKSSTLANAIEALIGAIYLDQGFDIAKEFCEKFILRNLDDLLAKGKHRDEKSLFQEQAQESMASRRTMMSLTNPVPITTKVLPARSSLARRKLRRAKAIQAARRTGGGQGRAQGEEVGMMHRIKNEEL